MRSGFQGLAGRLRCPDGPLIVVLNHPSWWDPLVGFVLTELFPDRAHYFPMDAHALEAISNLPATGRIWYRAGNSPRSQRVSPHGSRDPRSATDRALDHGPGPLRRRTRTAAWPSSPGWLISHVAWNERSFCRWHWSIPSGKSDVPKRSPGSARPSSSSGALTGPSRSGVCASNNPWPAPRMPLPVKHKAGTPTVFETLVGGKAGVGSVYDFRRSLLARVFGEGFRPEHGDLGVLPAPRGSP